MRGHLRGLGWSVNLMLSMVFLAGCKPTTPASDKQRETAETTPVSPSSAPAPAPQARGEWHERGAVTVYSGPTMGSTFSVSVSNLPVEQRHAVAEMVDTTLAEVDRQMSTWRDDSEIAKVNAAAAGVEVAISSEFARVLQLAEQVSRESQGAFDVSVAPVVEAWGFGASRRAPKVPSDGDLQAAKARVGYQRLAILANGSRVRKEKTDLRIDLAAIAPGFATDLIAERLHAKKLAHHLVDVGGEVRASGHKDNNQSWRVAIELPAAQRDAQPQILKVVALRDRALATSGDYRQYFEVDGVRYAHALDPRTGRPASSELASVSVLHAQAALADAYATTLMVLGTKAGWDFAQAHQLAVCLVVRTASGFDLKMTPEFEASLVETETNSGESSSTAAHLP